MRRKVEESSHDLGPHRAGAGKGDAMSEHEQIPPTITKQLMVRVLSSNRNGVEEAIPEGGVERLTDFHFCAWCDISGGHSDECWERQVAYWRGKALTKVTHET